MSSFLILYPDIPKDALVVSTSAAFDEDYPVDSTFYGKRHAYGQLAAANTSVTITYDLGTGFTRTVDHFCLGGAAVLKANGVTQATLQGSSNGSTWVNQLGTASGFQTRTFDGPDDDDLVFTAAYNDQYAATLAAYRYWRVTLAGGSAHKFPVSKIAFGAALDIAGSDREPDDYEVTVLTDQDADQQYTRGQIEMCKAFYPRHRVRVEWDLVPDATADLVMEKLLQNPFRHSVFLYTATQLDPLHSQRLMHCRVVDRECSINKATGQGTSFNTVKLIFDEMT